MGNEQIESGLADLREQLEMLRQARRAETSPPELRADEALELESSVVDVGADALEGGELSDQLQELIGQIEQELKESNPKALLAVFALGILIGRLLPR